MEYAVEVTEIAAAEIDSAYEWIKEQAPDAADRWYTGFMAALNSLRQNPKRCARVFAAEFEGVEIRQLVYGRRRGRYRILFTTSGDIVEIVRVLHGARAAARR
jgi:plasmid stabilization system protein ParE